MKENLANLFCFIALIFLVLFIIGLFKPGTALFWSRKPATKKRAATFNGLAMLLFVFLCGIIAPKVAEHSTTKKEAAVPPIPAPAPPAYKFQLVNTEHNGDDLYLKVVMDDLYPREALIEKVRQLREEYKPADKVACTFYYKKYTEHTNGIAGIGYLPDCSHCDYKDKEGHPVDFPYYHMEKPLADSLRALPFDTAGYTLQARYFSYGAKSIQLILSSKDSKALLVFLGTTGHFATPLIKRTVRGQEQFYDPEEDDIYYVVNRADGFVDLYNNKGLDLESVIEN